MMTKLMKVEEVAMRLGVSAHTIDRWYRQKNSNPDNEFLQQLPGYVRQATSGGYVRLWTNEGVWKLLEFKSNITLGRTGRMGKYGGKGTRGKTEDNNRRESINA